MTEQTETTETIRLYAARDASGRIYLTEERSLLPPDAVNTQEFSVAPEKVAWTILQLQVEEMRGAKVTIQVGDCHYATRDHAVAPPGRFADTTENEKGETLCRVASERS